MTISTLKSEFFTELHSHYPQDEIQSFFNMLAAHILKLSRLETTLKPQLELSAINVLLFSEAIVRLKNYEPIQYITGETEFYGLTFKLNQHTLVPRPETEELVNWIINDVANQSTPPKTLLDIGTGSGCIAVTLANHLPQVTVSALDISFEALKIASENATINKTEVNFMQQDILATKSFSTQFDIIVSNPPYVREQEKAAMQENVLRYEPDTALFVPNDDPLLFYRKISQLATSMLKPKGFLYFEINEYLSREMEKMLYETGFKYVEVKQDIFGKDRMIKAYNDA